MIRTHREILKSGLTTLLLVLLGVMWSAGLPAEEALDGVVVESVGPGGSAEKAGLRPGDWIRSWERPPRLPANPTGADGTLSHVFLWILVEEEQGPRGSVTLSGRRFGEEMRWVVEPGQWRMEVRPTLFGDIARTYDRGRSLYESGEVEQGLRLWEGQARRLKYNGSWRRSLWLYLRTGEYWARKGGSDGVRRTSIAGHNIAWEKHNTLADLAMWEILGRILELENSPVDAQTAYEGSLEIVERRWRSGPLHAAILARLGRVHRFQGNFDRAETYYRKALEIQETKAPGTLVLAETYSQLGGLEIARGNLEAGEAILVKALAVQRKLLPDSLDLAGTLERLGEVAMAGGNLERAEELCREALGIMEREVPGSLVMTQALARLGDLEGRRNNLAAAFSFYRRSLDLQEVWVPGSLGEAETLLRLGKLAEARGNLEQGQVMTVKALEILQGHDPDPMVIVSILDLLGSLHSRRGEFHSAEAVFRRSLSVHEERDAYSKETAASLNRLGMVLIDLGNFAEADALFQRARGIYERMTPPPVETVWTLLHLYRSALTRGDLVTADSYAHAALDAAGRISPDSLLLSLCQQALGELAEVRGHPEKAGEYYKRAYKIRRKLGSGSVYEADSLHALGRVNGRIERYGEAAKRFEEALEIYETLWDPRVPAEVLPGNALLQSDWTGYLMALRELKREEEAFDVLVRTRERLLPGLMPRRDLLLDLDLGNDVDRERRILEVAREEIRTAWADLSMERQPGAVESLKEQLGGLDVASRRLADKIVEVSPHVASFIYPHSRRGGEIRSRLEAGTVLLSYAVGRDRTILFVLGSEKKAFKMIEIPVGHQELSELVRSFREAIRSRADCRGLSSELTQLLLKPAKKWLKKANRIWIDPDGPLRALPFAALHDPDTGKKGGRYLVESASIRVLPPSGFDGAHDASEGPSKPFHLAAFGGVPLQPGQPGEGNGDGTGRGPDNAAALAAHRISRLEVEFVRSMFPGRTTVFQDADATEARVRSLEGNETVLHFACEGVLDGRRPLDSGLTLAPGKGRPRERNNGRLRVWEILEGFRTGADLVTLSSCETDPIGDPDSKGLLGLMEAFRFAGAKSLLVSLWPPPGEASAELMRRFYGYWESGMAMDEALRASQLGLIRAPVQVPDAGGAMVDVDASHPAYWAGPVLIGIEE